MVCSSCRELLDVKPCANLEAQPTPHSEVPNTLKHEVGSAKDGPSTVPRFSHSAESVAPIDAWGSLRASHNSRDGARVTPSR